MGENMNKPVAYCVTKDNHIECLCFNEGYAQKHANRIENAQVIPLYTHPVKELTDEEIGDFEYQIIRACGLSTANSDINPIGLRQIIKAILKKAQE